MDDDAFAFTSPTLDIELWKIGTQRSRRVKLEPGHHADGDTVIVLRYPTWVNKLEILSYLYPAGKSCPRWDHVKYDLVGAEPVYPKILSAYLPYNSSLWDRFVYWFLGDRAYRERYNKLPEARVVPLLTVHTSVKL